MTMWHACAMPPPYVFQCELCGFNIRTKLSMNATDDEKESAQWTHSLMVTNYGRAVEEDKATK